MNISHVVTFLPANRDACALYRMTIPHFRYPKSNYYIKPDWEPHLRIPGDTEAVMVQRQVTEENLKALKGMSSRGIKIVYDLDDHLWAIPIWNPNHAYFRGESSTLKGVLKCLEYVDAITVSTPCLKEAVIDRCNPKVPVYVVRNSITFDLFDRLRPFKKDKKPVVIGWAGTATHSRDLSEVDSVLADLSYRPDVKIEFMSNSIPKKLAKLAEKGHNIVLRGFVPVHEYHVYFSNLDWDISISPLTQCDFNRAKSNIKLLEAGALRIPCVASNMDELNYFLTGELSWLTAKNSNDWHEKLVKLIEDEPFRRDMGEKMYARTYNDFNIDSQIDKWIRVFENTCEGRNEDIDPQS